jgi:Uma2 family endonuclease
MASAPRIQRFTFDDFCVLVKQGQKADLIDGVIYMASPDNTNANELSAWLISLVYDYVQVKRLGKVFHSRVALRLDDLNSPEPDLLFVRKSRLHLVKRGFIVGPADLAVEIVSPESIERDYQKKRALFETAGVLEYWIVDEMKQQVTLLRLSRKGKYRQIRPKNGELQSQVLPGFWFRPEWFWQDPLPMKMEILEQILARES